MQRGYRIRRSLKSYTKLPATSCLAANLRSGALHSSPAKIALIFYGIELLTKGRRREGLLAAAEAMFAEALAGCIVGFESGAAQVFSKIAADRRASANRLATRMRRWQPLPECDAPSSR